MEPVCRIRTTPTREMDRQAYWPLLFHANHFCFHSAVSDSKYEHSYSAISDLKETKDYYVIFIKGNPAMVFAKKGDTEGSPEQALALLRGNGSIPT